MSVGFVMLAHGSMDRAVQVTTRLGDSGAPVVVHADRAVEEAAFKSLECRLSRCARVHVMHRRHRCEWGTWGIVAATLASVRALLHREPSVSHVALISGACLPLRPLAELETFLARNPTTDFIESVAVDETGWSRCGFDLDRFRFRFPFAFRRNRWMFDRWVALQRRMGLTRTMPDGLQPHLGSQWWCLTRPTLEGILNDPQRTTNERFFRNTWIPDESYFQSLARRHSARIESRSLTYARFDHWGRPHEFHDDHATLLRESGCFFARKIWPGADALYRAFPMARFPAGQVEVPAPQRIDRVFEAATQRRSTGRNGLYMQGRFPLRNNENRAARTQSSLFWGFEHLFPEFEDWLRQQTDGPVHGHLFAPERVEFDGRPAIGPGCLPTSAALRDANPCAFLTNLLWNANGQRQCYLHGPRDNHGAMGFVCGDPQAQVSVVTGAWVIPMAATGKVDRSAIAQIHEQEWQQIARLRQSWTRASIRIWTLADFLGAPIDNLRSVVSDIVPGGLRKPFAVPRVADIAPVPEFLAQARDAGLNLPLTGTFPIHDTANMRRHARRAERTGRLS